MTTFPVTSSPPPARSATDPGAASRSGTSTPRPAADASSRRPPIAIATALALAIAVGAVTTASAADRERNATTQRATFQEPGEWTLEPRGDGQVQMKVERRDGAGGRKSTMTWSFHADADDFEGLPDLDRARDAPVAFRLRRDAGTFAFEGRMRRGRGRGTVWFEPDDAFREQLSRGRAKRFTDRDMERLAIHDVRRATVTSLRDHGYADLTADDLVRLAVHGASPEFVDDMMRAGYPKLSIDDLVRLRVHGVSPKLVREYAALGYERPSADDLVRLQVHGAEPEFVRELRVLRVRPAVDDLVRMRVHGVQADDARAFIALGYEDVTPDQLVRFRIHGVSPDFARRALGKHPRISADELVRLRVRGAL